MFKSLTIEMHESDTEYTFSEWEEVTGHLEVSYKDVALSSEFTLPVFTREQWEEFKRAGDMAFEAMRLSEGL